MLVKIFERLLYSVLLVLGTLIAWTPFVLKNALAGFLAHIWFYLIRFRRRIILHNLARVFPRTSEEPMHLFQERCERLAAKNLRHTILLFLEILERFHWSDGNFATRVETLGDEHVQAQLRANQGFFFLTAHLGNWELITMAGKLLRYPLAIVTKRLRNGFWDRIWVRSRKRYGLELLEESGSGLAMIRGIRHGKAIGFILDQHTGEPHGIETTFLGLQAWCPKGLAILGTRLKCPILPAYMLRQPNGCYRLEIGAPLKFPLLDANTPGLRTESGALTDAGLRYHIGICNENMREWILKAPEQYLWLHRRFKNMLDYSSPLPWQL